MPFAVKDLRTTIREMSLRVMLWGLIAILYGACVTVSLISQGLFNFQFFLVATFFAIAASVAVMWVRTAKRDLAAREKDRSNNTVERDARKAARAPHRER